MDTFGIGPNSSTHKSGQQRGPRTGSRWRAGPHGWPGSLHHPDGKAFAPANDFFRKIPLDEFPQP